VYAVIRSGGKQERVWPGDVLRVESTGAGEGSDLEFPAVLVVDGDRVFATPEDLEGAVVSARVVGEELGPKVRGFTYRPKSNYRRRWGHRQLYTTVEITAIDVPSGR
jgi:large subunit ribosomal protein L21